VFPQYETDSVWDHNAIGIANSSNVQVYDNVINNCTNGIGEVLSTRGDSTHGPNTGQPYLLQNDDVHNNTLIQISNNTAGIVKSSSYNNDVYESWSNQFTSDTYQVANLTGEYFTWMGSGDNAYASADWSQWKIFSNDTEGSLGAVSSAGTTLPTVPTNLSATAISSSQINLIWTASTDNAGIASYKIYRGGSEIATSTTNSYSNTDLSAGSAYTYTVVAVDAAGKSSSQSASAEATTSK
jgi:hypothetical protein